MNVTVLIAFGAGAVATWVFRILFITLVPADRLPDGVRRALPHIGPSVMAALIVTELADRRGVAHAVTPDARHLALLVAVLVAWRVRNLAAPMAAAAATVLLIPL
jgi:branched-subunit amino acid transport protein